MADFTTLEKGDVPQEIKRCKRMAKQGNPAGYHNLGYFYEKGFGVKKCYRKAKKYYGGGAKLGCEICKAKVEIFMGMDEFSK